MSNKYSEAAEAIRREVVRLQNLTQAAAVLDELGSLEGAKREAEQLTAEAVAKREQAEYNLQMALREVGAAQEQALGIGDAARLEAAGIRERAEKQAREIVERAEAQAQATAERERGALEGQLKALNSNLTRAQAELDALEARTVTAKADAMAAEELRAEAEKGLKKVQSQIEKLRVG